ASGHTLADALVAIPRYGKHAGKDFVRIVMFDRTALNCVRYLRKGSRVAVSGRLSSEFYASRTDGKSRLGRAEIVVNEIEFLSPPPQGTADVPAAPEPKAAPTPAGRSRAA
ncbi:MAG: single-stranded DNA-binding protein, partial [Candidatus Dormibacteraeota bacterium]|nr:single-stranded DNA-binding protein [Candidatus Dormibacteraeota bacterium]